MSGSQIFLLVVAALGAALLAALVWTNGRVRRYRGSFTVDISPSQAWDLLDFHPDKTPWMPGITGIRWADGDASSGDIVVDQHGGVEVWIRPVERRPPGLSVDDFTFHYAGVEAFGDLMRQRMTLTPLDHGASTRLDFEIVVERRGPVVPAAVLRRLQLPVAIPLVASFARSRIAELRGLGELPPAPEGVSARAKGGWVGPALAVAATAWLTLEFGVAIGLALLVSIVVHEAGHVWSMRRHGHPRPRFYLVPFLGGVALSGGRYRSDAESAEITLMGPAFGLLPSLAALGVHLVTDDPWFAAIAAGLAVVNGFNLAPVPPLDGGRIAQLLLRPLGPRAWFAGSGVLVLLAGAGALVLDSTPFLVLAVLGAVAWSAVPTPPADVAPLGPGGLAGVVGAFAGLAALHAAAVAYAMARLDLDDWIDVFGVLMEGPFALY